METQPNILIVDDDADMRLAMATRLRATGFAVQMVANGNDALSSIARHRFDAAVVDVRLPDIDGFAVCEGIRASDLCKNIPVFMLTGTSDGIVRDFLGKLTATAGGNHHMTKPCDGRVLAQRISAALQQPLQS